MVFKYGPYSPSRLETGTCGYAFNKQYIDPNRPTIKREGLAQARGSAVHEIYERITKKMIEDQHASFNDTEIRQWVTEAVNNHPAAYEEIDAIIAMAKLYIRKPPAVLTDDAGIELKLAIKPKMKPDGTVETYMDTTIFEGQSIERPVFMECHYDDPEAVARGRADIFLISDDTTTAIVYDHKTQPNVEEADTFQMGFYAWVISRIYPFLNEIHTILHFARYGTYSSPYIWTQRDLYKIEDEFLTRASIIENRQVWDAVPHKNCQYCPYLAECPAMQEYIEVDPDSGQSRVKNNNLEILGDVSKAVKMAGLINVLDEVLGTAKDNLKEHVKMYGPIAIPGKIWEFRGEESIDWDRVNKHFKDKACAVFEKYGIDPKVFMSFNQTASKTVWMAENQELLKELSALFPRKTSTTFRGYKG